MSAANFVEPALRAFRQIGIARLAKAGLALGVILAVGYLAKSIDFEGLAQWVDFNDQANARWYQGKLAYLSAGMLFTAIGGPRQAVAFFGAYFFGLWTGLAVSTLAAGLGCALAALIARVLETKARQVIRGRVDIAFEYWRQHPVTTTLIIRLLPVGSNLLTNLAAGVTGVPLFAFVMASIAGYIPQMAVFALMGSGVDVGAGWQVALGIGLFAVLMIAGLWIYGRYRRQIRAERKSGKKTGAG
ncbi:TVP38/TMEM64 family protein [Salaquimonas pukyongi]|uniref:TVP38/TMEM64 family protein n=1 Tax=Salaquimonas pukyongi TaxID=2712698 RepID=UPI00096B843F|nr:VTT domain-containing protein [Salaquimonas pukyongi]